jgi:hypothetical protein
MDTFIASSLLVSSLIVCEFEFIESIMPVINKNLFIVLSYLINRTRHTHQQESFESPVLSPLFSEESAVQISLVMAQKKLGTDFLSFGLQCTFHLLW